MPFFGTAVEGRTPRDLFMCGVPLNAYVLTSGVQYMYI